MHIDRRDFVKLLGGSIAGFALGGVGEALLKLPNAVMPELYSGPRVESWKVTTCARCPGGCGLRVRLIDGFPVQAFGNPLSPVNLGGICPMGLTSIESLYHPDRLTSPMKKVNGAFVEISYAEAYDMLSRAIAEQSGKAGAVAFVAQTESPFMAALIEEFMHGVRSKKFSIDRFAARSAVTSGQTSGTTAAYADIRSCDVLVTFGAQLTEISESPMFFTRALNELRARNGEYVVVAPRRTPSASRANRWVPARPEHFEDVALGIAYVLLSDETYNKSFVAKQFKAFAEFRQLVLEEYSPAAVESRSGVNAEELITIARAFGRASHPVAYADASILTSSNGLRNAYAVMALNVLTGFAGFGSVPDNDLPPRPGRPSPVEKSDAWSPNALGSDQDIRVLLLSRSNVLFTSPKASALRAAILKVPLVVSFSPFIDETSEHAHLIIPDHDDLEKLDATTSLVTGSPTVSIQRPVLKPFYATTHTGDVLLSLIAGLKLPSSITAGTYEAYLQSSLKPVYEHGKGTLMNQRKPTELEKSLHDAGWQTDAYADYDEFWMQLLKYGGWWNPYRSRIPHTPTVTIGRDDLRGPVDPAAAQAGGHDAPLRLHVFTRNLDYKGNIGRNAILTEQFGMEHSLYYETWVEINPATAKRFSVTDRSRVKVTTAKGSFEAVAVLNAAVMPAMIDVPFGLGHTVPGPVHGTNPVMFCDDIVDDVTGTPAWSESVVQIERVGGTA